MKHALLAICFALLALAGCRPPLPEPELRAALARQAAERARFQSLSAVYDMSISGRKPGGRRRKLRCSGRLVAVRGEGLRMQGSKVLGMAKIFDLLLTGDRYKLNFIYGEKFYIGTLSRMLSARGAEKLIGGGKLDLAALLFPVPPLDGEGAPELVTGKREVKLVWRSPTGERLRQLVLDAASARPLRTEIYAGKQKRQAVILYGRPTGSGDFRPVSGFRVRGSGGTRFRLEISLRNMAVNTPVKKGVFKLKPPSGFKVIDVDEQRKKSGPEKK